MNLHLPGSFYVFKTNIQEGFSYFTKGAILYHAIEELKYRNIKEDGK